MSLPVVFGLIIAALFTSVFTQDACLPQNGNYEEFVRILESEMIVGRVVKQISVNGPMELVRFHFESDEAFMFDNVTSEIKVRKVVDIDDKSVKKSYTATLTCQEVNSTDIAPPIKVVINIRDVNDNPPVFTKSSYTIELDESSKVGATYYTGIEALDADESINNRRVYFRVKAGEFSSYFQILDPVKSSITLQKPLDFETLQTLTLVIEANDLPNPSQAEFSTNCTLIVKVKDADDQNPVFSNSVYQAVISKDAQLNDVIRIVPQIFAYDPDVEVRSNVSYSFHDANNNNQNLLKINPRTGVVTLLKKPKAEEVLLLLQATQNNNINRYGVALLAVQVQGSNVNAPVFSRTDYSAVVPDVFPVGQVMTSVIATDKDLGSFISYSLENDVDQSFTINSDSGEVILLKQLTTLPPQQDIYVIASDGELTSKAKIRLSIWQTINHAPKINNKQMNVTAERKQGEEIYQVNAQDVDPNDKLSYQLLSFQNLFSINNKGAVKIKSKSSLLVEDSYHLTVVVSDNGLPKLQTVAVIVVTFSSLAPPRVAAAAVADTDNVVSIVLGVLAAFFFILCVILTVFICKRLKRDKEHLDKVKRQHPSHNPRSLSYKQQNSMGRRTPHFNVDFREDVLEGGTSVQDQTSVENPLNSAANKGGYFNFGHVEDVDTDMADIQVETSVNPYSHPDNSTDTIYNNSQGSVDSEDYSNLSGSKHPLSTFLRNGSISTYGDSSDSEPSLNHSPTDSSDSRKILVANTGSLARSKVEEEEDGGFYDNDNISTGKSQHVAVPDSKPGSQKQELTVYF